MLGNLPEAYVLVMAYRNHASGDDGSVELAEREFDFASRVAHAASGIVVGQELTEVTPTKLSFWWNGRAAFRQAVAELTDACGGCPSSGRLGGRRRRLPGGRGVRPALIAGQPAVGGRC
jgi:hypothetical protein